MHEYLGLAEADVRQEGVKDATRSVFSIFASPNERAAFVFSQDPDDAQDDREAQVLHADRHGEENHRVIVGDNAICENKNNK